MLLCHDQSDGRGIAAESVVKYFVPIQVLLSNSTLQAYFVPAFNPLKVFVIEDAVAVYVPSAYTVLPGSMRT